MSIQYVMTVEIGIEKERAEWWEEQINTTRFIKIFDNFSQAKIEMRKAIADALSNCEKVDFNDYRATHGNEGMLDNFINELLLNPEYQPEDLSWLNIEEADHADWYWAYIANKNDVYICNYSADLKFNIHNMSDEKKYYYFEFSEADDYARVTNLISVKLTNTEMSANETHNKPVNKNESIGFTFGRYPQTAKGDDMTPIEWIEIFDDDDAKVFMSAKSLDISTYADEVSNIWKGCKLQNWLNREFYEIAFDETERTQIVQNSETQDYVTLITEDEIERFGLSFNEAVLKAEYSDYARQRYSVAIRKKVKEKYSFWWTRTPGRTDEHIVHVCNSGFLNAFARPNGNPDCVRPVIRIKKK